MNTLLRRLENLWKFKGEAYSEPINIDAAVTFTRATCETFHCEVQLLEADTFLRATPEDATTSCSIEMPVTTVSDLERAAMNSPYDYRNYRNSRQRSKSRDNVPGSGYYHDSGMRYNSRTRSVSRGRSSSRRRSNSMGSSYNNNQHWQNPKIVLSSFTDKLRGVYNKKVMSTVDSYVKDTVENAVEMNNINFLMRCAAHRMIPFEYWVDADKVRKTREVLRFLEQCASRLMLEDIRMHKKATDTLSRSIAKSKEYLKTQLSARDFTRLLKLVDAHFNDMFHVVRQRQRDNFARLQKLTNKNVSHYGNGSGDSKSQSPGSPKNAGQGRRWRRGGRQDSERKSRSGSDSSTAPASD
ncbi:uncharacterized protein LOC100899407 [Galendromus occidentalis]|uniref:Uncharacterized protein LOC100899407 n=1 Tax=Galendromus occidentalis TaxID=34638 RepID=A0AAJ6QQL4_9ACAR|nr:uncharacterized protein LOC100899407 [Galendromus occidentalis]